MSMFVMFLLPISITTAASTAMFPFASVLVFTMLSSSPTVIGVTRPTPASAVAAAPAVTPAPPPFLIAASAWTRAARKATMIVIICMI